MRGFYNHIWSDKCNEDTFRVSLLRVYPPLFRGMLVIASKIARKS